MVLEFLLRPAEAEKNPWKLFFIGILCSCAGILGALLVFFDHASPAAFFLTSIAVVYFVQRIINLEEKKDEDLPDEKSMLRHHAKALQVFMFLFLGFVVSFSLWYVFLPDSGQDSLKTAVFGMQEKTISCINSTVQGCVTGESGVFQKIVFNNVKVLAVTFAFSLFYGAGAMFILVWNASVIGAAAGILVRNSLASVSEVFGLGTLSSYFGIFSASILRYAVHGFFEILAYFIVALAGGMLSLAIAKHGLRTEQLRKVASDALSLVLLAGGLIFFAALIEVYVTPLLF